MSMYINSRESGVKKKCGDGVSTQYFLMIQVPIMRDGDHLPPSQTQNTKTEKTEKL